jgi:DNA repair protein RecN (Recombination protein N)
MLTLLRVKNLALVEEAAVAFAPGLNVVTGETGAGKSILIGALYLLLGERADTSAVRAGEAQCVVEATFQLADPRAVDAELAAAGLEPCDHGQLILRRTVKATGGGQAYVNDAPVTLPLLKRLGARLVDLHGPHDHQSLFQPAAQLDILDAFAKADKERAAYADAFAKWEALLARREELSRDVGDLAAQIDLLAYRVKEIEEAEPVEGEEEKVRAEQQTTGHAQRILELGQQVVQAISEDENAALSVLAPARKALDELARLMPAAQDWPEALRAPTDALAALSVSIQRELSAIDADPARLEWLDQRLATYDKLKRKYGGSVEEILAALETSRARLKDLRSRDEQKAAVAKEIAAAEKELRVLGAALRKRRAAAAEKLPRPSPPNCRRWLRARGVRHRAAADRRTGGDGPGPRGVRLRAERRRADAPVAGHRVLGRNLARDAGAQGRAGGGGQDPAAGVRRDRRERGRRNGARGGRKLAQAAKRRQLVAITHLPPVAACGAHHFAVRKTVRDGRTHTSVAPLTKRRGWTNSRACSAAAHPPAWPCATPPNCSPPRETLVSISGSDLDTRH